MICVRAAAPRTLIDLGNGVRQKGSLALASMLQSTAYFVSSITRSTLGSQSNVS